MNSKFYFRYVVGGGLYNKMRLVGLLMFFFIGIASASQKNVSSQGVTKNEERSQSDKKDELSIDVSKYKNEIDEYQKILRQSYMLKLLIKRQQLLKQLGVTDPDEIFPPDGKKSKLKSSSKNIGNEALLISTFKIGKGPIKAKIFVYGVGVIIVTVGQKISDTLQVENISPGAIAVKRLNATGDTFYLPSLL